MTNQQILQQAIQKAIDGGWDALNKNAMQLGAKDPNTNDIVEANFNLIFNHDFAKALWGDKEYQKIIAKRKKEESKGHILLRPPQFVDWQLHLMQMVIADNPIKYLGENI